MCVQSPVPPQYVFWYHNARMINYDAARGVTVLTEPGPKTQSALAIRAAGPQHSGNYTCAAANTEPAHIYVYVSEGSQCTLVSNNRLCATADSTQQCVCVTGDKMAATLSRSTSRAAGSSPVAGGAGLACLLMTLAITDCRPI